MKFKEKIVNLPGEIWAPLVFENFTGKKKYAISSKGRMLSYLDDPDEARLLSLVEKTSRTPKIKININNRTQTFSLHKLVATTFIQPESPLHNHVIHLDRNTHNNEVENLRWVTREEALRKVSARNDGQEVIKFFPGEVYKIIDIKSISRNYAITNFGRLISFSEKVEQGFVMKVSEHAGGYKIWRYKDENKKYRHHLIHRLVAQYFLEKPSEEHDYVVHLDFNKKNNHVSNLKWETLTGQRKFSSQSEACKAHVEANLLHRAKRLGKGIKLTEAKVRVIKKIVCDENRKTRLKMIARQFGISPMQLYRIKTGENWGWVKIEDDES